jgi:hypothetical protein
VGVQLRSETFDHLGVAVLHHPLEDLAYLRGVLAEELLGVQLRVVDRETTDLTPLLLALRHQRPDRRVEAKLRLRLDAEVLELCRLAPSPPYARERTDTSRTTSRVFATSNRGPRKFRAALGSVCR